MQIQNTTAPSFQSIKSVKCEGLYKKYPQLGQQLVDTFKQNPTAMEFCKKYDVDIVFYACKEAMNAVASYLHIFYDNPALSKMQKFFKSLTNNTDKISMSGFSNEYGIENSIKTSTQALQQNILPCRANSNATGALDAHIKLAEESIQKDLAKKAEKIAAKKTAADAKQSQQAIYSENKDALKTSIQDLMDSTK